MTNDEKPWKDLENLLQMEKEYETQKAIANELGCTSANISYWLDKAHNQLDEDEVEEKEENEEIEKPDCFYYDVCGNKAPGLHQEICDECLSLTRENDRLDEVEVSKFDNLNNYMSEVRSKLL